MFYGDSQYIFYGSDSIMSLYDSGPNYLSLIIAFIVVTHVLTQCVIFMMLMNQWNFFVNMFHVIVYAI